MILLLSAQEMRSDLRINLIKEKNNNKEKHLTFIDLSVRIFSAVDHGLKHPKSDLCPF